MTTVQWILADDVVALVGVASWLATGVTAALSRGRLAFGLLVGAVLVTFARVATVAALAGRGQWFAQEKVLLNLPLLAVAGLAAVIIAGPRLLAARRMPGQTLPAGALVSLFTAGYAALAGLVVTFLAGYPLTLSTALIAVSAVCAGAQLTSRVITSPAGERIDDDPAGGTPTPGPGSDLRLPRRKFISMAGGGVAAASGIFGVGLLFRPQEAAVTGGGPGETSGSGPLVSVADLRGARVPAPGGAVRQYTLTAGTAIVSLASGRQVSAWTYGGQLPGPAITATEGDLIEVTLRNIDIEGGVTAHWHGYDVPCGEDGAPGTTQDPVKPGGEFVYRFRADQAGTYWYHTHQASDLGVRKGLYGTLVVKPRRGTPADEAGLDLTLPVHTFDQTVVVGNQDGGAVHTARPGTAIRLRLVNTDSSSHWFAVAGTAFRVAAVDGRDLHQPGEVREVSLRLPAAGRYDVVFAMPNGPVALVLDNAHGAGVLLRPVDCGGKDPDLPDTSAWPALDLLHYGIPAAVPFDANRANRRFTIILDRSLAMVDGSPAYAETVNGRGHPLIPDQFVAEGDLVRLTVVNRSVETHPWHLHGHTVLLLSRNRKPFSGSPVWVDTFDVAPGEVWEVAFRADNPGIWMNHCHNLPHQEQGMMLRLVYAGVTTPFEHAGHVH